MVGNPRSYWTNSLSVVNLHPKSLRVWGKSLNNPKKNSKKRFCGSVDAFTVFLPYYKRIFTSKGGIWETQRALGASLARWQHSQPQQTRHLMHANVFVHRHILTHQMIVIQKGCSGACDHSFCLEERGIGPRSQEVKMHRTVAMAEIRGSQRIKPQ